MRGMGERGVFNETRGWHLSPPFRASSGVGDGGEANRVHQPENRSKFRHEETAAPAQAYAQRRSWLAGVIHAPALLPTAARPRAYRQRLGVTIQRQLKSEQRVGPTIQSSSKYGQRVRATIQVASKYGQRVRVTIQSTSKYGQRVSPTIQSTSKCIQRAGATIQSTRLCIVAV